MNIEKVTNITNLKDRLKDGENKDFFVQLNHGLMSSKLISYNDGAFYMFNFIDESEEEDLTDEQFMLTTAGRAMQKGALYECKY